MKREYMKPVMGICELQQQCHILTGSNTVNTLGTNLTGEDPLIFLGGSDMPAR